jgi:hypothetical protein
MRGIAVLVLLALAACDPNPTFVKIATDHIAKGPAAACCTTQGGKVSSAACAAEAEEKCGFARGATTTFVDVKEAGNAARNVTFDLAGPRGRARCIVFVADHGKGNGGITADIVACTPR